MEYCINKKTKEKIFSFDIKNEYGIKDFFLEKKLRIMSANEELICPECGTTVILRAGEIKIPHFSHKLKTKNCFYSTYTYNENRAKALKILYDKLKKYNDIKILELSKNFKGYGIIDIFLEGEDIFEKRKYAIMIKNTMENINKWEKLHIELLKEEITPIYFNYGATSEIKNFQKKISESFFYKNLMNLTTNHGLRLIDTEKKEFYSIITTFYLTEDNKLKKYENTLYENKYSDFLNFVYNFKCENKYKFLEKKQNYIKEILKYKNNFEPFLMINQNQEIFLVINTEYSHVDNEYNSLMITYIPLNYFMFNSINSYMYLYYYPEKGVFKENSLFDSCSQEENEKKDKEIKEFFNSSDFNINKIISIKEIGFFKNDIEEFLKNYKEIKNKIFKYNYLSEDSKKEFELYKIKNINNVFEINNFIKNKEIKKINNVFYFSQIEKNKNLEIFFKNSSLEKIIDFLKYQFLNFYEVIFNRSDIKKILNILEDQIFNCNNKNEITKSKELYEIFKNLLNTNNSYEKNFKLLFSEKEIKDYEITKLFYYVYNKSETIFRCNKSIFVCPSASIFPFFENNSFELNILNTYHKLTKEKSIEEKYLKVFENNLEIYFKNNNLNLFLKNTEKIEKEYLEKFLIENLDNIIKENAKELLIFIINNMDLNKSIIKVNENLDYLLNKDIKYKEYNSFIKKINEEKNIVLFEAILGTKYEKIFSLDKKANILNYNYDFENGASIIKKNILNKKINLNEQNDNKTSLFFEICLIAHNTDLINFCLENGADPYLKNKDNKTPYRQLKKRIKAKKIENIILPKINK
ncbi:hypothetical protein [Fusobacterium sp.]|uniref:competence protein CoiA family protein n=1 Tax=Fusobacterium sp. TaxID=68766 RepID=UPI00263460BB|nr:hypothetical protein [Fusobacterium sp.]